MGKKELEAQRYLKEGGRKKEGREREPLSLLWALDTKELRNQYT
jgi:hypothetical protein